MRRAATAVLALIAACAGGGDDPRPVIRVSASALGDEGAILRRQLDRYAAAHPELRIELYPTPDAADLRHQLYVQWLDAGVAQPDVLQLDLVWTPELAAAGWIAPVPAGVAEADAFVPAAVTAAGWDGTAYAVPWFVDVGMIYYRTDLVPAPPATLAELTAAAERARRDHGVAGLVWQGARYEGLVTVFVEYLGAFGGAIVDGDRIAVADPAAVAALGAMVDAVEAGTVPAAALGFHEEESRLLFQSGRAAVMRNWPYCRALLADPARSSVAGKVGVIAMPPAVPGGRPTAALGGAALAVNRRSHHPDHAFAVVAYLTAPEQMRERALAIGQLPARRALYDDPALAGVLGAPGADVRAVVEAAVARPATPVYTELSGRLQVALHRALAGEESAASALAAAAPELQRILDRARPGAALARRAPSTAALVAAILAIALIAGAAVLAVRRHRRRRIGRPGRRRVEPLDPADPAEARAAWALVAPALACIALVAVFPLVWTAWESLHDHDLRLPWTGRPFVGAANYVEAAGDARLWAALGHTAMFAAISVTLELVLGLALALALDRAFRGRGVVRAAILVPWAIPTVVAALVWSFLFQPAGIADQALAWVGASDGTTAWFNRAATAWIPVVLADVWKTTPFVALLLLAGLQTIDDTLYEAAAVDGASRWQRLSKVTLPLLRPTIAVVVLFRLLDALRVFDLIFVMTGGGPGTATEPLAAYTFTTLVQELRFGYGAALSMIVFAIALVIATVFVRALGAAPVGSPR
jgi:ABC-type sugar transport system permease subunit/ABC-type glycerol-3-phosphate transport system substrate-binding protein